LRERIIIVEPFDPFYLTYNVPPNYGQSQEVRASARSMDSLFGGNANGLDLEQISINETYLIGDCEMVYKIFITVIGGILFVASAAPTVPEPRRIDITAKRFSYTPNQITLKKGEPVVLVFHTQDVTHGFKVPDLNIKADDIKTGKDSEVSFTPTQPGHFVGKCAHFCGKGHGSMTLQIDVAE
jgi:cytochrome c oxidase subunit 2